MPSVYDAGTGDKQPSFMSVLKKIFLLGLILTLVLAVYGYSSYQSMLKPVDPQNPQTKTVSIPAGTSTTKISKMLFDAGLIRNQLVFRIYSRSQGLAARMQAGEYSIDTGMSVPEIIRRITGGEVDTLAFTIPEGYNLKQITDTLAGKGLVDRARFTEMLAEGNFNYDFLQGLPAGEKRLEGYLFPDTYRINKGTTEEEIINIMLARFAREITPEFKEKAGALGLTLHQAVTLASIVEREAAKDEERPRVAAVFLNRIKKGWKLESCATVQYALGTNKTRLLYKDLQMESLYNTYKYKGLPPGPIAAPGRASLQAAVNPAQDDYMFFVVSEEGQHVFSRTIQEHNRNKAKYISRFKTP
jgi:UPF0755 protein